MRKQILLVNLILLMLITACSSKPNFKVDKKGNKQYVKDSGVVAKNEWVTIKGDDYFFDLNGNLVLNQWVYDEFYVDENGKKQKNYWYTSQSGELYYLDDTGKYLKNCTIGIDNKDYAFDNRGVLYVDKVYKCPNEESKMLYSGKDGVIVRKPGFFQWLGNWYYIDDDGYVINSSWKDDDNKWYYFGPDGIMQTNKFIGDIYYVGEDGSMISDTMRVINGQEYSFDQEGKATNLSRLKQIQQQQAKKVVIDYDSMFTNQEAILIGQELIRTSAVINKYYKDGLFHDAEVTKLAKVFMYIEKNSDNFDITSILDYISDAINTNKVFAEPKINASIILYSIIRKNYSFYSAYNVSSGPTFTQYMTGLEGLNKTAYYDSQSKLILETIKSTLPLEHDNGFDLILFDRTNTGQTVAEYSNIKINNKYVLMVHLSTIEMNPILLKYTLIHEYGHYLTLNESQFEPYTGSKDRKAVLGRMPKSNSYINKFIDIFWDEVQYPYEQVYYDPHKFVTDYGATNVEEDLAESFTYFVFLNSQPGYDMAELKINFFYQYPEMVNMRNSIRARIVLDEFKEYW